MAELKKKVMEKLKYLFRPLKIGSKEVKNRVSIPAMGIGFGIDEDGCVNLRLTKFYAERQSMLTSAGGDIM